MISTILACGQCWFSIAQVIAIISVFGGSIIYYVKDLFYQRR